MLVNLFGLFVKVEYLKFQFVAVNKTHRLLVNKVTLFVIFKIF